MAPELSLQLLWLRRALELGAVLGLIYDALRPLRRRCRVLSPVCDGIFFCCYVYGLLWLTLAVCRGVLRGWLFLGILLGWLVFDRCLGRYLRPIFDRIWHFLFALARLTAAPARLVIKKFREIQKLLFSFRKKWFRIKHIKLPTGLHGRRTE